MERGSFIHDYIGRLDITMQHPARVRCAQGGQEPTAKRDRLQYAQPPLTQAILKSNSRDEWHDQIDLILRGTVIE